MNPSRDLADQIADACIIRKQEMTLAGEVMKRSHLADIIRSMLPAKPVKATRKISDRADEIYQAYPRKVAPLAAKQAISVVLQSMDADRLLSKVNEYAKAVSMWPRHIRYNKDGVDTVPHPATWFRRGSYAEDTREWYKGRYTPPPAGVRIPSEPAGWRQEFPDFVDRDKTWDQLDPFQRDHIIHSMDLAKKMSEAVDADSYDTRLRNA